jgi:hypothetical protein
VVDGDVAGDAAGEGVDVLVHAPEGRALGVAERPRIAGADGVEEDDVGLVEQGVGVGDRPRTARRVRVRRGGQHLHRPNEPMCSHMDEEPGAAVVHEGDRPLLLALAAVGDVGGVEHAGDRLAVLVAQGERAGGGRVGDGASADGDAMARRLGDLAHRRERDLEVRQPVLLRLLAAGRAALEPPVRTAAGSSGRRGGWPGAAAGGPVLHRGLGRLGQRGDRRQTRTSRPSRPPPDASCATP